MSRRTLTDGSGHWFNTDSAVCFSENTRHDGRNLVSVATGDQFLHEEVYYTKGGKWILHHWSQWQGSLPTYEEIDEDQAIAWLSANSCQSDSGMNELPAAVQERVRAEFSGLEL